MNEQKTQTGSKALKLGSYSAFLALVVVAIVIVVNMMVAELPSTVTKFDTSSLQLYTLSDSTVQILENLDEDITMYYIVQNGGEDSNIEEMLNRYTAYTSHIKVVTVDPTSHPGFSSTYTDDTLTDNSVIVESAKRYSVIAYEDIYPTEYSDEDIYNYYTTGTLSGTSYFDGEGTLTTAIDYVTSDNLPKLYYTTGHGETALSDTYQDYIDAENILTEEIATLSAEEIPADASAVMMNVPTTDITEEEASLLLAYMEQGGKFILITSYDSYSPEAMPHLSSVTEAYGLKGEKGLLIEGNQNNYMSQYPYYLIPTINENNALAANLNTTGVSIILPFAHGITATGEGKGTLSALLTTSSDAYIKENIADGDSIEKADGDKTGTFYVGASVSDSDTGAKLVWYSCPYFLDDSLASYNSGLFLSNLTILCEKSSSISIAKKALQIQSLVVSSAAAGFWGAIMILVLPVGCIVSGLVIWNKRRKR